MTSLLRRTIERFFPAVAALLLLPGLYASAQEVVIRPQFDAAGNFHKGVAPVRMGDRWGFIDRTGAWVVRPRFASIRSGHGGLFPVLIDKKWGYADTKGDLAIAPRFDDAGPFEERRSSTNYPLGPVAPVRSGDRWGYVYPAGHMNVPFGFLEIGGREGDFISARDSWGWGVFTSAGAERIPERLIWGAEVVDPGDQDFTSFERAYSISERTLIVRKGGEEKLLNIITRVNKAGDGDNEPAEMLVQRAPNSWSGRSERFASIRRMSEGLAPAFTTKGQWGFLHKGTGDFIWGGRFEDAGSFSSGFAPVKIAGRWGYIDRAGRVAVEPTYDAAFPFRGEYAVIRKGDKRGFLRIDPQGGVAVFVAPRFDDAFRFTEGLAPVKIGGQWGYISDGRPWSDLIETGISSIEPQ